MKLKQSECSCGNKNIYDDQQWKQLVSNLSL